MNKEKRHHIILHEIQIRNRVLLTDLASMLNVSMDTVRRDVKELDEMKKLRKVHGGAVSNGFNVYSNRFGEVYELGSKSIIAQKGVSLLNDGDIVLISGGSTNLELVKLFPKNMDLTLFTPSLPMAVELMANSPEHYEVYLIGGKLSRKSQLAIGGSSINILSEITADICFLGTGYIDISKGISELDWEITQMKKAMIRASKKTVSLTISEKLNTANRFKVCEISTLDTIITELDPSSALLDGYRNAGINLL